MEIASKLLGFIFFIGAAAGLFYLLKSKGRVEGIGTWSALEKHFATNSMPAAYTTTSGMVGLGEYRNTLQMAMDSTGVFMHTPAVVRFGSKPVHIPYREFVVSAKNPVVERNSYTYTQFIIRGQSVCLNQDDAKKILARKEATP